MKLDLKEWIKKFSVMFEEMDTNNTVDTWVPVFSYGKIQHRVLPADAITSLSITNWNVVDSSSTGTTNVIRRGDVVTVKFNGVKFKATSARTDFATIPAGFRPITETAMIMDANPNTWFYCRPNGTVAIQGAAATNYWGAVTYLVQK